jgi:hypothetical protein
MYYVNRNDELLLPHHVECGLVDVVRNFGFRSVGEFLELLAFRLEYSVQNCNPVCIPVRLMPRGEIIALYCEQPSKHVATVCGEVTAFLNRN